MLEPLTGMHRNVWVFDFKSLYPSLIRTFNIDPLSYVADPAGDKALIETPGGGVSVSGDARGRGQAKRAIATIASRADDGADVAEADVRVAIGNARSGGEGGGAGLGALPVGRRGQVAPKTAKSLSPSSASTYVPSSLSQNARSKRSRKSSASRSRRSKRGMSPRARARSATARFAAKA